MYIASVQISNYKSYYESSELALRPGINIIAGQNNAGKTALLEALSLATTTRPHRSPITVPNVGDLPPSPSTVTALLAIGQRDLAEIVPVAPATVRIAVPAGRAQFADGSDVLLCHPSVEKARFLEWLLSRSKVSVRVQQSDKQLTGASALVGEYTGWSESGKETALYLCRSSASGRIVFAENAGPWSWVASAVIDRFKRRIYGFRAERFNLGVCAFGNSAVLKPDASNLGEVLSNLQSNPARFRRYSETVRRILPQIQQITVRNLSGNQVEILVWPHDPSSERLDLAIPLNEGGTGVGQVLAILYVVLNADHPQTILIDEPQSFLHPGAVRKLIEVLREHPQHQYILTTHSPTVITASNPSTITLVKQREGVSDFQVIDPAANEQLRQYMLEIGARLSDAFGADDILWVEGPTEEICFPLILEKVAKRPLMGTAIMAVKHTGDLEGKLAKTVFEIYERLSKGSGLLPPAVGFIFDKEGRSVQEQSDIQGKSSGLVAFTPRRLYENYLLSPRAIAAIINGIDGFRDPPVTEAEIQDWIEREVGEWRSGRRKKEYGPLPDDANAPWEVWIHGANLLKHLFRDLSETRVSYDKIAYSVALTEWLIENSPEDLRELADLMQSMLDAGAQRRAASA